MYDGYIGNHYYKCTVSGSTSNLYSKLQYDVSTNLRVVVKPEVYYVFMGVSTYYDTLEESKLAMSTSVAYSKTYLDLYNDPDFTIPANGYFKRCTYDSYIGTVKVLNGVLEVF